jgi:hypothetical protein
MNHRVSVVMKFLRDEIRLVVVSLWYCGCYHKNTVASVSGPNYSNEGTPCLTRKHSKSQDHKETAR